MIIAIDGPSGTGKSTVARGVAKKLGIAFFDTGAMYRSAAWWVAKNGIDPGDGAAVATCIASFQYRIEQESDGARRYFVGETEVTREIRSPEISSLSSKIAALPSVRSELVKIQRDYGAHHSAVFEGRDMGTVVFPNAELKIFLTARSSTRAERRYQELLAKFPDLASSITQEQILRDIEERDRNDSTRSVSPLKQAPDAILIDTSDLSAEKVIEKICALAEAKTPLRHAPMRLFYASVYWAARFFFKLLYRLEIHGLSHFRSGAAIIAPNHASNFDPPVVSVSCPEEVHFLGKSSLFKIPVLSWIIRNLNTHPVSRSAKDAGTFQTILQLLQEGHKIILFPEGYRTRDGELQPIERGLPFLVMKAKARVQPVYVQGTFEIWPRTRRWPRLRGKIRCVFGTPFEASEFERWGKEDAEKKIQERMSKALRDLKAWTEAGCHGIPP
jgi:cytidylate kinase